MLDDAFCTFLEYKMGEAFQKSNRESVRGFWCDGVALPDSEADYSKKSINDNKQVVMTAYIGATGQDIYELTLKFGKKASSRYARNLDISECLPDPEIDDWWDIDVKHRAIWVQLG